MSQSSKTAIPDEEVERYRDDLEAIAESELPAAWIAQALLRVAETE